MSSGATVSCNDIQSFCVCNSIRRFLHIRLYVICLYATYVLYVICLYAIYAICLYAIYAICLYATYVLYVTCQYAIYAIYAIYRHIRPIRLRYEMGGSRW